MRMTILPEALDVNMSAIIDCQEIEHSSARAGIRLFCHLRNVASAAARTAIDAEIVHLAADPAALAVVLATPARVLPDGPEH